ncbi:MAG: dimethylglycine dehydrogenase, partial [Candidatus Promineifilaceae bacterium]
PGVRNAYSCIGLRAGIGEGGGLGKVLAEIMIHGESEWDSWCLDPRQYTGHATVEYTAEKAIEEYQNEFVFHRPHEYRLAGRPAKTTPLYNLFLQKGGFFGPVSGWERVMYFNDPANPIEHVPSFRFSTWHDLVGKEVRGVRERAGITEISGFARFEVSGPGAAEWLDGLNTNRLPKVGRTGLAYFCRENGHLYTEATINRISKDRFMLLHAATAEFHDWQWLEELMPTDGSVTMVNQTGSHTALHLAGPKSQEILKKMTLDDVSNKAFPWLATREITIGFARVTAIRVTFTGELGYELHFPVEYSQSVYDRICKAGEEFDMVHFGLFATESMRLEKGYLGWKAEIMSEVTPLEAGLGRFVNFKKGDFIGREALLKQKESGLPKTLITLIVDNDIAPAHEGDPVYSGDDLIGVVTSGGYGHTVGKNIALAYVDTSYAELGTKLEISIIGDRSPAEVVASPIFDPGHDRPRG